MQALLGIVNPREVCPPKNGPPKGPFVSRVSAMRHGVAGTKLRPGGPIWANVANIVRAEFMVTVHVCVPVQAPLHPVNVDPDAGTVVSVTVLPLVKFAEHVTPQLMDPSLLVTVPPPVPCLLTVRTNVCVKIADTVCAEFMVTVHACMPEQAPLHPAKTDPGAGSAVSVTVVPLLKFAVHVTPQLMDPSLLVTVPFPAPCLEIVSVSGAPVPVKPTV